MKTRYRNEKGQRESSWQQSQEGKEKTTYITGVTKEGNSGDFLEMKEDGTY